MSVSLVSLPVFCLFFFFIIWTLPPPPSFLYILPSLLSVVINGGLYPLDVYDTLMGCVCVTLSWWTQRHHFPTGKSHTQTHKSSSSVKQSHLTITAQGHGEGRPKFEMNACVCPQITQCSNRSIGCFYFINMFHSVLPGNINHLTMKARENKSWRRNKSGEDRYSEQTRHVTIPVPSTIQKHFYNIEKNTGNNTICNST